MGGRGSRSAAGGGGGGAGGGGATITPNANGGVTITNQNNNAAQQFAGAGSGVSDVKSHTTYFTPADRAIVSDANTDGTAIGERSHKIENVGYYQTGYYANLNHELRDLGNGRISKLSPRTQKVVDAMDRNMRPLNDSLDTIRWTDTKAIAGNLGISQYASKQEIINRLKNADYAAVKHDFTSSSWDGSANAVAGKGGRDCLIRIHYAKGAMAQFSPTRKEGEVVGARGVVQRYSNARMETVTMVNGRDGTRKKVNALVVDCYVDS